MADDQTDRFTAREALFYHETIRPGKIEIIASKPMATQRDLSLAYSPGVAVPVQAIADDPSCAARYTARSTSALEPRALRASAGRSICSAMATRCPARISRAR